MRKTNDINVISFKPLISPQEIRVEIPLSSGASKTVCQAREAILNILSGRERRKLIIVGPCSIHDSNAAMEYAKKLLKLSKLVEKSFLVVMRTYFEKPRTTIGWKGLINDPFMDNTFNMNEGLRLSRKLLSQINDLGLPTATEFLDPITPQYLGQFICWTAIGARTTESQTHREMASGLSSPLGFKNNTDGNVEVAINAWKSAMNPHNFLGIDQIGRISMVSTSGNKWCHLILRGGKKGPNYDPVNIEICSKMLRDAGLEPRIMVDCSHDNSNRDYRLQPKVLKDCIHQVVEGADGIIGFMLESNLKPGKQNIGGALEYGVSITDGCLGFDETKDIILEAQDILS